jgi:hypothetical protein
VHEKSRISLKNLAPSDTEIIYRHNLKQLAFIEFSLPFFEGKLSPSHEWIKLAKRIPSSMAILNSKVWLGPPFPFPANTTGANSSQNHRYHPATAHFIF